MEKPAIAGTRPQVLDLAPGTYHWCACGLSKSQPWCDGSHKGTAFQPVPIVIEEEGKRCAMCTCKQSAKAPFCDGTHKEL